MNLPLLRTKPIHLGVLGVEGADNPLGVRTVPSANVYHVDFDHLAAKDTNDGTDPEHPLKTIQAAVDKVGDYDWIVVRSIDPDGENVITNDYTVGGNYVKLIGAGPTRYTPVWLSKDLSSACLDLRAVGWHIIGFNFNVQNDGTGIEIRHTDSGANDIAIRTIIEGCHFTRRVIGLGG